MPTQSKHWPAVLVALCAACLLAACSSEERPMKTVDYVDLERFMGDWYVIANIPTFVERGAHNAVESYALTPEGTIATTFTFRAGSFDGPLKTYHPTGFVVDRTSNALWGMQFIWPIKADFRIIYLTPDYQVTAIGRAKRDYVWVMARESAIPDEHYQTILSFLDEIGYDTSRIERVPQRW
ncbi:lipocalin family protein [Thioalkalicoccus limnaeus]|uniref:Outer membrane lipoprotein Blc n=1 Tax=Thioalkalicoccus limnaeus TaxID=120681 RepID=A0ABV4BGQ5_9GAMM